MERRWLFVALIFALLFTSVAACGGAATSLPTVPGPGSPPVPPRATEPRVPPPATEPWVPPPATEVTTPAGRIRNDGPAVPVLYYTVPPNYYRGALPSFQEYHHTRYNAWIGIYPFRPFAGNIQAAFQSTLLREWIYIIYQEENVAGQPTFQPVTLPGADSVLTAQFAENIVGLPKPHIRILIVADGSAAIVDLGAQDMNVWQLVAPGFRDFLSSLRVETQTVRPPAPQPGPGSGTGGDPAVAGLYRTEGLVNVQGHLGMKFYLLSADGRVYLTFNQVPGDGDPSHFDFDAAQSSDRGNYGTYEVQGSELVIHMGMGTTVAEDITTSLAQAEAGRLTIYGVVYTRR